MARQVGEKVLKGEVLRWSVSPRLSSVVQDERSKRDVAESLRRAVVGMGSEYRNAAPKVSLAAEESVTKIRLEIGLDAMLPFNWRELVRRRIVKEFANIVKKSWTEPPPAPLESAVENLLNKRRGDNG